MSNNNTLVAALREMVGEANVIEDPDRLGAYAVDGLTPRAVVSPGTAEEISRLLAHAGSKGLAVVPRGNGTKMAAGGIPRRLDLVLSLLRLNRITGHDVPNLSLSVEAGVTLAAVQEKLAGTGRGSFLPLDPPYTDQATIGGIIATNGSGPRRYVYNTARDLLLGIKAVTPNGDIVAFGGQTVKNVSGYDMTKLMIGSWGALGVITEITTKLLPLPEASATLLTLFGDLAGAGSLTRRIIHSVLLPSAVELTDEKAAGLLGVKAKYLVAFSLEGVGEAVERQLADIAGTAKEEGALETRVLKGGEDRAFWRAVRDLPLAADVSVVLKSNFLISRQTEMLGAYERMARAAGIDCAFVGHAGNGILRSYFLGKAGGQPGPSAELIGRFTDEAVKQEGNCVVESCPGDLKAAIRVWGRPRGDEALMRRLKEEMDPAGVLSPGRFVGEI